MAHRALDTPADAARAQFALDVQYYLTLQPRQLPSRYLYDALGSALFDAICELPWYGITRAERRLLRRHGPEVLRGSDHLSTVVELGCGSGEKLKTLIDGGRPHGGALDVHLIDVSDRALEASAAAIGALAGVRVIAHQASYGDGLGDFAREPRRSGRTLVLFLGSNIGNFDRPAAEALLGAIRAALADGDALLVGADLVKPEAALLLAYDDPLGVTAAFNRNLLVRINRELDGDFDVDGFAHRAVWNGQDSRVEMHLVSRRAQRVHIPDAGLDIAFATDEPIWTESSYKYRPAEIDRLLDTAGFQTVAQWIDTPDAFALTLAVVRPAR